MSLTVKQICDKIEMPEEMTEKVCSADSTLCYSSLEKNLELLFHPDTWGQGLDGLRESLGEDRDGAKMLACMLHCAIKSYAHYQEKGIGEDIYIETMKCFSRFVGEHKISYGSYGFDRAFWTPRQISSMLFRVGELEYELWEWKGEKAVSIHIPSDSRITPENIEQSLQMADEFMDRFFPEYAKAVYVCDSWLLSPKLQELLPQDSNIIRFQNRFAIESVDWEAMDVIEWVFQNAKCPLEELPENTSLQRRMKAALVKGEKIGVAAGVLKKDGK